VHYACDGKLTKTLELMTKEKSVYDALVVLKGTNQPPLPRRRDEEQFMHAASKVVGGVAGGTCALL
jgi:hypothetical protein